MTPTEVAERFKEAAEVLRRLPEERPRGYRSSMPDPVKTFWESWGQDGNPTGLYRQRPTEVHLGPPEASAIDRMLEVLDWNRALSKRQRKLIWARAYGASWDEISWRHRKHIRTVQRWHIEGLVAVSNLGKNSSLQFVANVAKIRSS